MNDSSTSTVALDEIRAEVRVRDQVMRYARTGSGLPVVMLGSPADPEPLWPGLHQAIARRFRLIVPDLPRCDTDVAAWLAAFLEGLGSTEVRVVASSEFCMAALELVIADLDRIARVVLVTHGDAGGPGLDSTLASGTQNTSVPLLVVRRGTPASEAVPLVVGFCAEGAGGNGKTPY